MGRSIREVKKKGSDMVVFPDIAVCRSLQMRVDFVEHAPAIGKRCYLPRGIEAQRNHLPAQG
jgi:predicted amidohydrolase